MADVVGGEIESEQTARLLSHARTDVPHAGILQVVVSQVQNAEGVV